MGNSNKKSRNKKRKNPNRRSGNPAVTNKPKGKILTRKMNTILVSSVGVILVAIVVLVLNIAYGVKNAEIIQNGTKVQGVVTDVRDVQSRKGPQTEVTTVSYTSAEGIVYVVEVRADNVPFISTFISKGTNVGEEVTVYYDPENHREAAVIGWESKPFTEYLMLLLCLSLGIMLLFYERKDYLTSKHR